MNSLLMTTMQAGLFVFVLGLVIVFFGIGVIVTVISIVGKIMKAKDGSADSSSAEAPVSPIAETASAPVALDDGLTDEKVAAITAVLTAYFLAEGKSPCEFRIRKIKRL